MPPHHSAHGRFDAQAKATSATLWLDMHRGAALGATLAVALAAILLRRRAH